MKVEKPGKEDLEKESDSCEKMQKIKPRLFALWGSDCWCQMSSWKMDEKKPQWLAIRIL